MRHLDVDNKYSGGKQEDRYTQNEYYLFGRGFVYALAMSSFFGELRIISCEYIG